MYNFQFKKKRMSLFQVMYDEGLIKLETVRCWLFTALVKFSGQYSLFCIKKYF